MVHIPIVQPAMPAAREFAKTWAAEVEEAVRAYPRHTHQKALIATLNHCIEYSLIAMRHLHVPDELDLKIAKARLLHKLLHTNNAFDFKVHIRKLDDYFAFIPGNLPTLIFMYEQDPVPNGKLKGRTYVTKEYTYTYVDYKNYNIEKNG